jgi:GNAT superfamily N-acetyltransferase
MKVFEPLHVGGVHIEEVDVRLMSDDDIARLNAFNNLLSAEADPEDPPEPIELTTAGIRNMPDFIVVRSFWGRDLDGSLAASGSARWTETEDNRHLVRAGVRVRPDRRRRGVGKAMLRLIADVAEAEGRRLLVGGTSDRVPAGEAFARRIGAEAGMAGHTNRLLLSEVDHDMIAQWISSGPRRATGYSLFAVDGPYPDEHVEGMVDVQLVMNTAPRDDLDVEDEVWTVELAREAERTMIASGTQRWSLFAQHDATGDIVGWTEVAWNPAFPQTVWQWGTGVRPEHRGHALGKWLKAAMLQRVFADRPDAVDIRTGNADSNDPMLGINRQLGFKPFRAEMTWQISLDRLRNYVEAG